MLGKAQYHAFQQDSAGRDRYDMVIVDAPATGHGLELLRVPRVIVDVAPPGLLRKEAERAWQLFSDPERAGVLLVTIPEDMPASETLELDAAIRGELNLPVAGLVVNQMMPRLFQPGEVALLEALAARSAAGSQLQPYLVSSHGRAEREALQHACMERLRAGIKAPCVTLPLLLGNDFRRAQVEQLAGVLQQAASFAGTS
jgi:anion-transporting  ArsA/GET3 family ATPase